MGCECIQKKNEDNDDELMNRQISYKDIKDIENESNNNNNINNNINEDFENLKNQGWQIPNSNNENFTSIEKSEQKSIDENISRNEKYADYPKNMLNLINKIRQDPSGYAEVVENSIQNILEIQSDNEKDPKYIYKKKVKYATKDLPINLLVIPIYLYSGFNTACLFLPGLLVLSSTIINNAETSGIFIKSLKNTSTFVVSLSIRTFSLKYEESLISSFLSGNETQISFFNSKGGKGFVFLKSSAASIKAGSPFAKATLTFFLYIFLGSFSLSL